MKAYPATLHTTPDTPFSRLQKFVAKHQFSEGGYVCPCCKVRRRVKYYWLTNLIVFALARLYQAWQANGKKPVFHQKWCGTKGRGNYQSILAYHGLIAPGPGPTPASNAKPFKKPGSHKHSGYWKPTKLGRAWLEGEKVDVREHVIVDAGKVIDRAEETVTFREAAGRPYDPEACYDPPPKKGKKKP